MLYLVTLALAQDPAVPPAPPADLPAAELALNEIFGEVERLRGARANVAHGVAHLSGTVPSSGAREEAERVAASLAGVLFVDNQLAVDGADAPSVASQDATLQATLTGILQEFPGLADVRATVTSGVVRLTGEVLQAEDRERAVALAGSVAGVVYVDDALTDVTSVRQRLDAAVASARERMTGWISLAPLVLAALLALVLAVLAGRAIDTWEGLYSRVTHRPLLRAMLGRMVRLAAFIAGVLLALEILGATSLVGAVAGAAGVVGIAFGFAFQDIVENYLAGILLSVQQPFAKNDLVHVAGITGVVVRLSMRNTLLLTEDGNHVYLPNADVFKGIVTNFTRNPRRRFAHRIGIGTHEDLVRVAEVGAEALRGTEGVLATPSPAVQFEALGDSNVVVVVYGWVDQLHHDFLRVRSEALRRLKEAYDCAGFDMPEPIHRLRIQRDVPPAPVLDAERPVPRADVAPETHLQEQVAETRAAEAEDLLDR